MSLSYIEHQVIAHLHHAQNPLAMACYEGCTFEYCDFSGADLRGFRFVSCTFRHSNLSLAKLARSAWQGVTFEDCKLVGLDFEQVDKIGLECAFRRCLLHHSVLAGLPLRKTLFAHCQLHEVDFGGADLREAVFDHCDLSRAVFLQSNLEKADFRSAVHYTLDPEQNRLKKARFALGGLPGLLQKYDLRIEE